VIKLHLIVVTSSNVISWTAITPIGMMVAGTMVVTVVGVLYSVALLEAEAIIRVVRKHFDFNIPTRIIISHDTKFVSYTSFPVSWQGT
jgi:hypothetical protein